MVICVYGASSQTIHPDYLTGVEAFGCAMGKRGHTLLFGGGDKGLMGAAARGVKGYYPSFDITPPNLVSGVVTDSGIYAPYDLHRYFKNGDGEFGQRGLNL